MSPGRLPGAPAPDAIVIGAGVIGLTTAVVLLEAGVAVEIWTDRALLETTSANSGAIWGPFLSTIDDRVLEWSFDTLRQLQGLARNPRSGVAIVAGSMLADFEAEIPDWTHRIEEAAELIRHNLPDPYLVSWRYTVPVIDAPRYLSYLAGRFRARGGKIHRRRVVSFKEALGHAHHLINCAGLGGAYLAGDELVRKCKGQLVIVENPGLNEFMAERGDGPELMYILPQGDKVVLGGTAEWDFDDVSLDLAAAERIIQRCVRVCPALAGSRVLGHRVGVRPCRDMVRLEHEVLPNGQHVVHNYGHGGSGISVSWGCANAVLALIDNCRS